MKEGIGCVHAKVSHMAPGLSQGKYEFISGITTGYSA